MKAAAVARTALPICAVVTAAALATFVPASAWAQPSIEPAVAAVDEQDELAADAAADALEAAEVAVEQAETAAEADSSVEFKSKKAAEEYPAYARKIEHIRSVIAKVYARKLSLEQLPESAHLHKRGVAETTARIKAERHHLREVRAKLRAKKVAARE